MIALLCVIVAVVACLVSSRNILSIVVSAIISGLWGVSISYFGMPTLGFFYPGTWICMIIAGLIGGGIGRIGDSGSQGEGFFIPAFLFALFIVSSIFTSCEIGRSDRYYKLIGKVEAKKFEEHAPIVDTKHIILVPKETALNLAKNVLNDASGKVLGSQLQIDEAGMAIQRVAGELWWIIPLDFKGYFQWKDIKVIPGYIRVSAQDPNRPAQLVEEDPATGKKFEIKYTRESCFNENLDRMMYFKYPYINREDYTFEVDDNWKPYYVVSATEPTIGFSGYKNKGAVIFDPQTGEMEFKKSGELPEWVDRYTPANIAYEQIKWWGKYSEGWGNVYFFGAHKNIQKPTHEKELWFIQQGDKGYFFTGMTSNNDKDTSLLGVVMYSSRDEGSVYLTIQGADENSVLNTVSSMLGANSSVWQPVHPLPYNIYGVGTYVVPVIAKSSGSFQGVAIVNINNTNIRAFDESLERALAKYRVVLTQHGNEVAPSGASNFKRIGPVEVLRTGDVTINGNKMHYLLLKGYGEKAFSATGETNETLPIVFAKPGDMVSVDFIDTEEERVSVEKIEIAGIKFKKSPIQASYDAQRAVSKKTEADFNETNKAEREWEQLTPEQKRNLLKNK